jgi:hypothetical protein
MDSAAEYLAEAVAYEEQATKAEAADAREKLLSLAARWRHFAKDAAEYEATRPNSRPPS